MLRLGRIEWMRPTYHTKRHIYPVGYAAVRAVELSAERGRGKAVECLCEILESADSFSPMFRQGSPKPSTLILSSAARAPWACKARYGCEYNC